MKDLIDSITKEITRTAIDVTNQQVQFSDRTYTGIPIADSNFKEIAVEQSSDVISFVDGGSAPIVVSPGFSVHLIRLYAGTFRSAKKIGSESCSFALLTKSIENANHDLSYESSIFPVDGAVPASITTMQFDSFDPSMRTGTNRVSIQSISNIVRRFAEIAFAQAVVEGDMKPDVVVLDGTLQCTYTDEDVFVNRLIDSCKKNSVSLCGLAKTTTLMTNKGHALSSVLHRVAPQSAWYYHPLVSFENSRHRSEIAVVKLHARSKRMFRFELFREQLMALESVVKSLASYSSDPAFLGYPYGLIDADKHARVSQVEANALRTYFKNRAGPRWQFLEEAMGAVDAHDVLDRM